MKDVVSRASSWLYKQLPKAGDTKKAAEVSSAYATEASKELKRVFVVGESPGFMFVRLAGLSGALAVAFGAYGAHVFRPGKAEKELKLAYETGNRYHLLHSVALLCVPLTARPHLVGTLMSAGMLLFCGSCYYHALTGSTVIRRVTPYGGMLLIAAWASMML